MNVNLWANLIEEFELLLLRDLTGFKNLSGLGGLQIYFAALNRIPTVQESR